MKNIIISLFCLLPIIAFSQQVSNDPNSPVRYRDYVTGGSDGRIVNVTTIGIKGDSTDESTRIQTVIDSFNTIYNTTGKKIILYFPPEKIFGVGRPNPAVQKGVRIKPGVSILGNNTKFVLFDNAEFFKITADEVNSSVITSNTTIQDSVLTFSGGTTGFAVGQLTYLRIGQAAYDSKEPDQFGYYTVKAVTGTTVTLDRPVGYALTVAAVSDTNQRRLIRLGNLCEDIFVEGINMVSSASGINTAEAGLWIQYGRRIGLKNIHSTNANTGTLLLQFVEHLDANGIYCNRAIRQSNIASFGRGAFSIAECNGVTMSNIYVKEYASVAMTIEAKNYNLVLNNVHIKNNLWDSTRPVFATLGSTDFEVHGLFLEGYDIGSIRTGAAQFGKVKIYGLHLEENCKATWSENDGVIVMDGFEIKKLNGVVSSYRRVQRSITGAFYNNSNRTIDLWDGFYNKMDIFSTTGTTGFDGMYFNSEAASACNITSLVAGRTVHGNYGTGLVLGTKLGTDQLNKSEKKQMIWYGTTAMPLGQWWTLYVDMYECTDSTNTNRLAIDAFTHFNYDLIPLGAVQMKNDNVVDSLLTLNGRLRLGRIDNGTAGTDSILVTSGGIVKKVPPSAGVGTDSAHIFNNGLTPSVSGTTATVKFGGVLLQNTSLTGTFQLNFGLPGGGSNTISSVNYVANSASMDLTSNLAIIGGLAVGRWNPITTGTSSTATSATSNIVFDPASAIASYTLTLPAIGGLPDGFLVTIHAGGTMTSGTVVTSLTISPNTSESIIQVSAPTTIVAGDCIIYKLRTISGPAGYWYREK